MDRQQIATAHSLFYEHDRLSEVLRQLESGKGVAVAICGTYLKEDVVAVATKPLVDHYRAEIGKVKAALKQLGWSGR